jgi:acyl-CoA thioesterase YciA
MATFLAAGFCPKWTSPVALSLPKLFSCYVEVVKTGRTSVTVKIDTFATRRFGGAEVKVTEGTFIYVAIDAEGRPRPVDQH